MTKPITAKQAIRYAASVAAMAVKLNAMIDKIEINEDHNPEDLHEARNSMSSAVCGLWDASGSLDRYVDTIDKV